MKLSVAEVMARIEIALMTRPPSSQA